MLEVGKSRSCRKPSCGLSLAAFTGNPLKASAKVRSWDSFQAGYGALAALSDAAFEERRWSARVNPSWLSVDPTDAENPSTPGQRSACRNLCSRHFDFFASSLHCLPLFLPSAFPFLAFGRLVLRDDALFLASSCPRSLFVPPTFLEQVPRGKSAKSSDLSSNHAFWPPFWPRLTTTPYEVPSEVPSDSLFHHDACCLSFPI